MASDIRNGIRNLFPNGRFTLVAIITLAVGMGAATSIFSVSDWVLFRSKQLPSDVYVIGGRDDQMPVSPVRFDFHFRAYKEQTAAFSEYARAMRFVDNITKEGQPIGTYLLELDANFLPMFGIKPFLGRNFLPDEGPLLRA